MPQPWKLSEASYALGYDWGWLDDLHFGTSNIAMTDGRVVPVPSSARALGWTTLFVINVPKPDWGGL